MLVAELDIAAGASTAAGCSARAPSSSTPPPVRRRRPGRVGGDLQGDPRLCRRFTRLRPTCFARDLQLLRRRVPGYPTATRSSTRRAMSSSSRPASRDRTAVSEACGPERATEQLRFAPTSNASAVRQGSADVNGFSGLCVQGPGDEGSFPATVTAESGALTYDASTIFVSFEGTITGGEGSPCGASSAPARVWIAWRPDEVRGRHHPWTSARTGATPSFATGNYACTSQMGQYIQANGMQDFATSGGTGTLVVTQTGATLTAGYTGDSSVSGTLELAVTSATTASAGSNEVRSRAPCPSRSRGCRPAGHEIPLPAMPAVARPSPPPSMRGRPADIVSRAGALATRSLICTKQ